MMPCINFYLKSFLWACCLIYIQQVSAKILEGKPEFLSVASDAVAALLQTTTKSWCSMNLVSDGASSPVAVHEVFDKVKPEFGTQVYEVTGKDYNHTKDELFNAIKETSRTLKAHQCVLMIVATGDPVFLETLLGLYEHDLQLVWKQRPILVTNIPLQVLKDLIETHWGLFGTSAMAVHVQDKKTNKRWIGVYSHLPFSPEEGGEVIRIASWTTLRGLVTAPQNKLLPQRAEKLCCGETMSMKEALKDPVTLNRILKNPRTFRFKKPVRLVITAEHWPTHIILRDCQHGVDKYQVAGSMGSLINAIASSLNFTYKLVRPKDGLWGSRNSNGSWSGMVGMVHRHEADMALGPHDVTQIRTTAIDYTAPIFTDARQFVLAQNRAKVNPWGFLQPLSPLVWVGVVMTLGVIAGVTVTVGHNYKGDPMMTYAFAVLFHTYRLFFAQGFTMKLKTISERIVVLSWLLGAMIIYWSYSTNLMSLLAVRYAPRPVQTIRDLLDNDRLTAVFPLRTALSDYVLSQESGILKEVADLRNVGRYKSLHYNKFQEALDTLVLKGDHAIATCTTDAVNIIAKYFSEKGSCNFYIARETFVPFTLAMIVQKGSPLVEAVSHRVRGIVAGGLYHYWLDSNLPNSTSCKHMPSSFTVKEPLAMTNIWGMFVLLASGLAIAVLIFWIELFLFKCRYTDMDKN